MITRGELWSSLGLEQLERFAWASAWRGLTEKHSEIVEVGGIGEDDFAAVAAADDVIAGRVGPLAPACAARRDQDPPADDGPIPFLKNPRKPL